MEILSQLNGRVISHVGIQQGSKLHFISANGYQTSRLSLEGWPAWLPIPDKQYSWEEYCLLGRERLVDS